MSEHRISVGPVSGGWELRVGPDVQPQMFLSGRRAEEQAKGLAQALSRAGDDAFVDIHDRSQALVATARYYGESDT